MRLLASLLLLLCCPILALTAEIDVPEAVPEHTLIVASNPNPGTGHLWFVVGPRGFEQWIQAGPNNSAIAFTGPPGRYLVMMAVGVQGGAFDQGQAVVIVGGEPEPNPTPVPVPVPVPGQLEVVCLFETTDRTSSEFTTLMGLRKYLEKESIHYHNIDKDTKDSQTGQTPTWLLPYLAVAKGKSLPLLLIGSVSEEGTEVVAVETMPATTREAIEKVEEHR